MCNRKDAAREKRIAEKKSTIAKACRMYKNGAMAECELIAFIANIIGKTRDYNEKLALTEMLEIKRN